jgi:hypothetical protein
MIPCLLSSDPGITGSLIVVLADPVGQGGAGDLGRLAAGDQAAMAGFEAELGGVVRADQGGQGLGGGRGDDRVLVADHIQVGAADVLEPDRAAVQRNLTLGQRILLDQQIDVWRKAAPGTGIWSPGPLVDGQEAFDPVDLPEFSHRLTCRISRSAGFRAWKPSSVTVDGTRAGRVDDVVWVQPAVDSGGGRRWRVQGGLGPAGVLRGPDLGMGVSAWYRDSGEHSEDTVVGEYGEFALRLGGPAVGMPRRVGRPRRARRAR